ANAKFQRDPDLAKAQWDEAERRLACLNDLLGKSKERLSLLGAIYKRRAGKDPVNRAEFQRKALQYYIEAYEYSRDVLQAPDPYPGLNAIALAWLAGQTLPFESECLAEAESRNGGEDFWDRVYRADALMLRLVMSGRGKEQEVVAAYKLALQHAAPHEAGSAIGQMEYLKQQKGGESAAVLDRILAAMGEGNRELAATLSTT
ncbi:MAG TPA: tetratricopeptide repeat-containing protein, partial [Bryobacteraceae bacterium]|nr:tetratricopeptide repeat-containing protein [Bryobacteraceae bacterium]